MLPMSLMTRVVNSQKERSPVLPSQDQMIQEAEKYIATREERLEKIENAVKEQLTQQADMAYGKLANSNEEMNQDASFSAAKLQLKNLNGSLAGVKKINQEAYQALNETILQLIEAKKRHSALNITVQHLEKKIRTSKMTQNSEVINFLHDVEQRAAIYTVNPHDSRLKAHERKQY